MTAIVIDVSVIIKWFAQENEREKARLILDFVASKTGQLVLPSFAQLEVINVLNISKGLTNEKLDQAIIDFYDLNPQFVEIDREYAMAISQLMTEYDLASYDAAFIAVANQWNIPLFTADYKHHKKEVSKNIVWLKEWKGKL